MSWTFFELQVACKAYSDRYDLEVDTNFKRMITLAESRMSRIMRQREMSTSHLIAIDGSRSYNLPVDFAGLRDISIDEGISSLFES